MNLDALSPEVIIVILVVVVLEYKLALCGNSSDKNI